MSKKTKHTTLKPSEVDAFIAADKADADEFDALPRQDSSRQIDGWFTPSTKRPLPQVVKGTIVDCCARKNPTRSQNPHYLVLELAAPVTGFRMPEDDSKAGFEDTMKKGEIVGVDMRQALEKLREYRGKVKIVFLEKVELDDRTWWKTAVYAQLGDGNNGNLNAVHGARTPKTLTRFRF